MLRTQRSAMALALIVFRLLQSDQRFSIDPRSMSLPDDIFAPYSSPEPTGGWPTSGRQKRLPLQIRRVPTFVLVKPPSRGGQPRAVAKADLKTAADGIFAPYRPFGTMFASEFLSVNS